MPKEILIDSFNLSIVAQAGLPNATYDAIARAVASRKFRARLQRAVQHVVRGSRLLRAARIVLSQ